MRPRIAHERTQEKNSSYLKLSFLQKDDLSVNDTGGSIFLFPSLLELCSLPSRDSLQKLIVASLDYSHSGIPRIILSKILTASSPVFIMY